MNIDANQVLGLTESVCFFLDKDKKIKTTARIDSGANVSSIDVAMAAKLKLGPIVKSKIIKSANGQTRRPVVEAVVEIKGKLIKSQFTVADRKAMKYDVLIGQNTLREGSFLIDPSKGSKN